VSDELGLALLGYGRGCAKYTKNPREKMMEEQFLLGRYHFLVPLCCYCLIAQGHLVFGCGVAKQEENELRVLSYVGRCFPGTLHMSQNPFSR
jgi:hypothetical protein